MNEAKPLELTKTKLSSCCSEDNHKK